MAKSELGMKYGPSVRLLIKTAQIALRELDKGHPCIAYSNLNLLKADVRTLQKEMRKLPEIRKAKALAYDELESCKKEMKSYRDELRFIEKLDPIFVGCQHSNPCDNSCACYHGVRVNGKKPTGCPKALARRVLDAYGVKRTRK